MDAAAGQAIIIMDAGLRQIDRRYFVLLPWATPLMRRIERGLRDLPFGAQYIACRVV
jgi:hypothetical protein